jgi:hypothetical protein
VAREGIGEAIERSYSTCLRDVLQNASTKTDALLESVVKVTEDGMKPEKFNVYIYSSIIFGRRAYIITILLTS